MSLAAIIEALFDAGASREMIVAAVRAHEASATPPPPSKDEIRKEKARLRQRRHQEKKRQEASDGVMGASEDDVFTADDVMASASVEAAPPPLISPSLLSEPLNSPPYNPPSRSSLRSELALVEPLALIVEEDVPPKHLFEEGWKAYPLPGRKRSSKDQARPFWMRAAKAVGGEQQLLECVKRYASSPEAMKDNGEFVKGFHLWLKLGRADNYTDDQPEGEVYGNARTGPRGWGDKRTDDIRSLYEGLGRSDRDYD